MIPLPKYAYWIALLFTWPTMVFAHHDDRDGGGVCHYQAGVVYIWASQTRQQADREKATAIFTQRLIEQEVEDKQVWEATKKGIELAWAEPAVEPEKAADEFYEWCVSKLPKPGV